jgi:hypothetical protein
MTRLVTALRRVAVPTERVEAAVSRWQSPPRLVVVGRQGVGKTTLCNAWSGQRWPVGLGGTTDAPQVAPLGLATLVDTPAIERFFDLDEALGVADGMVWVIDGLAPLFASERAQLAPWTSRLPTLAIVSRVDMVDAEEHREVVERVSTLLGLTPILADLRRAPPRVTLPAGVDAARRRRFEAALDDVLALVNAVPRLPERSEVVARLGALWRTTVRHTAATLTDRDTTRLQGLVLAAWAAEVACIPIALPNVLFGDLPSPIADEPIRSFAGRTAIAGVAAIADAVESWPAAEEQAIALAEARAALAEARPWSA